MSKPDFALDSYTFAMLSGKPEIDTNHSVMLFTTPAIGSETSAMFSDTLEMTSGT
jgi:hypothetical protein